MAARQLQLTHDVFASHFKCPLCNLIVTTPVKFPGCPHYYDLYCIDRHCAFKEFSFPLYCASCGLLLYMGNDPLLDLTINGSILWEIPHLLSMSAEEFGSYTQRIQHKNFVMKQLYDIRYNNM